MLQTPLLFMALLALGLICGSAPSPEKAFKSGVWEETVYEGIREEKRRCSWYKAYSRSRMHFQWRHSMEVAPECEQRQPRESSRRREPDHQVSVFSQERKRGKPENSEIIMMAQPQNTCWVSLKPAELSIQKPHLSKSTESCSQLS